MRQLFLSVLLFFTVSSPNLAQTTVPYAFTAGTAAKAAEVNANFQALAGAIDTLAARVSKLENQFTPADVVGTFAFATLETATGADAGGVGQNSPLTIATHATTIGSVTLNANGTFSRSAVRNSSQIDLLLTKSTDVFATAINTAALALTPNTFVSTNQTTASAPLNDSGSWSLSGKVLTINFPQGQVVLNAAGPSLFISSSNGATNQALILLVRTN